MTSSHDYDVIVVGGGNAALVSALAAHEAGARVAVLECAPKEERGGNSRFSGAIFRVVHGGMKDIEPLMDESAKASLKKCTIGPYPIEKYREDMMRTTKGLCDKEQMEVMLEQSYDTVKWMRDQGVRFALSLGKFFDEEKINKAGGVVALNPGGPLMAKDEGTGLVADLWAAVERTSIDVFYDTPVCDLLINGDSVRGVRTRQRDCFLEYNGQVILACGGFEASPRLRRQYLGEGWDLVVVRGTRFNTGSMQEKALAAGAASVGHFGGCHATPQDIAAPKFGHLPLKDKLSRYSYPFCVMVNLEGKRFMDEGENHFGLTYAKTGGMIGHQPQAKAFQIFDQQTLHLLEPRYNTGTPVVDDTLEGLATKLGIDVLQFMETMSQFNASAEKNDKPFNAFALDGRSTGQDLTIPKSNWAIPLNQPPFVCYPVTCGITFTYGGLKVDTGAHVLNNEGLQMPGLWAVGEIAGGLFAFNYPGGSGLPKGAVFGRIAGREAAKIAAQKRTSGGVQASNNTSKLINGDSALPQRSNSNSNITNGHQPDEFTFKGVSHTNNGIPQTKDGRDVHPVE